jgi:hypothetical protein
MPWTLIQIQCSVVLFWNAARGYNHYVDIMDSLKRSEGFFCTANSFENTYNDKAWLERKRDSLVASEMKTNG